MSQKISICQTQAPTTAAAAFTASKPTTIDAAVACNPTAANETLSVWIVQDGGAEADAHIVYDALPVNAGDTVLLPALVNQCIVTGGKLFLQAASVATAITVTVSGRQ